MALVEEESGRRTSHGNSAGEGNERSWPLHGHLAVRKMPRVVLSPCSNK